MRSVSAGIVYFLATLTAIGSAFGAAISGQELAERARYEREANPGAVEPGKSELIPVGHFEIPKSMLVRGSTPFAASEILKEMEFERDGRTWVRWIPNSRDTRYKAKVAELLARHGLSEKLNFGFFKGYETASRSLFVVNPETGTRFSIKGPSNQTEGIFNDKPLPVEYAEKALLTSEYLHHIKQLYPRALEKIRIQYDTISYSIPELDQALLIRELVGTSPLQLIPLAAFVDEKFGGTVARVRGSSAPIYAYIRQLDAWGVAYGKFIALSGMASDSAHGQNFLVEVDEVLNATGVYELRDPSDARVVPSVLRANGGEKLADFYERLQGRKSVAGLDNAETRELSVNIAPFHAVRVPEWFWQEKIGATLESMVTLREPISYSMADDPRLRGLPSFDGRSFAILHSLRHSIYRGVREVYQNLPFTVRPMAQARTNDAGGGFRGATMLATVDLPETDELVRRLEIMQRRDPERKRAAMRCMSAL